MSDVLLLMEYASLNGGERSLLATLADLRAAGFAMSAACPPEGPLAEELTRGGVEVHPFLSDDDQGRRLPLPQRRVRLAELLRRTRPDLLHANSLSMSRLSGPVAADAGFAGFASVGHLRDIVGVSRAAMGDLNRHRRLLAVSDATRRFHIERGLDGDKTFVLFNGVDLQRFRPRRPTGYLHRELGLPDDAALVGCIGQVGIRKGTDALLEAAARLLAAHPTLHVLVVGERHSGKDEAVQFEQRLHAAADRPPLRGHVHFLGRRNDVPRLLNELTLLVHPARQEPLGRVLLEAAAAGAPVVATDVGGTAEIFSPIASMEPSAAVSCAATLVQPDDAIQLADAIDRLLSDPHRRAAQAGLARRRAESAFDARRAAAGLAEHYHAVLESS